MLLRNLEPYVRAIRLKRSSEGRTIDFQINFAATSIRLDLLDGGPHAHRRDIAAKKQTVLTLNTCRFSCDKQALRESTKQVNTDTDNLFDCIIPT